MQVRHACSDPRREDVVCPGGAEGARKRRCRDADPGGLRIGEVLEPWSMAPGDEQHVTEVGTGILLAWRYVEREYMLLVDQAAAGKLDLPRYLAANEAVVHLATSIARLSRITITLTWPGYSS